VAEIDVRFDEARIAQRIAELADEIAPDYSSRSDAPPPILVVLLKGAFVFAADLVRELDRRGVHPEVDFLSVSSYGDGTESSGVVRLRSEPSAVLEGRRVLLVDDILDTGRSLDHARRLLAERGAVEVRTCVLLDKPSRRAVACEADHVGFHVPDEFLVGYGIDHAERYRHLPYLGVVRT
jgi:hypoxanthine phosphoribosyltransferase